MQSLKVSSTWQGCLSKYATASSRAFGHTTGVAKRRFLQLVQRTNSACWNKLPLAYYLLAEYLQR